MPLAQDIPHHGAGHCPKPDQICKGLMSSLPTPCKNGWIIFLLHCLWLKWAASIYQDYQRSLNYRGAVDFDDLIRLALAALKADPQLVERLHQQWPYILEDEAQDSSRLQEEILRTADRRKRQLGARWRSKPGHL